MLVGTNASLKRSVLWNNVYLGSEVELKGYPVRQGERKTDARYLRAVVGTDSTVGQKSIVKPGVKVWPDKIVSGHHSEFQRHMGIDVLQQAVRNAGDRRRV